MRFTNSLRWRLQAWHGLILILVLCGLGVAAYRLYWNSQLAQLDELLTRRLGVLSASVRGGRPPERIRPPLPPREEGEPRPVRPDFRPGMRGREPTPLAGWQKPPELDYLFNADEEHPFFYSLWARTGQLMHGLSIVERPPRRADFEYQFMNVGTQRVAYFYTPPGECILVGRSLLPQFQAARRFGMVLGSSGVAVLLVGLAGGWWLASRAIKPISVISSTAERISSGNLSDRIPLEKTDNELDQLANVLNNTFARLEETIQMQQQFTSDAAHELRTPLSVILTETQSMLTKNRSPEEYKESLEVCQRAAGRMRNLVNALLTLARLDSQVVAEKKRVDLCAIVTDCVALIKPLAAEKRVSIDCRVETAFVLGDSARLELVFTNLLSNAVLYNLEGGQVTIRGKEGGVEVSDTGQGITAEDLPKVFDRFYRADKARTSGGTGLGLSIAKAIVEEHKGSLAVASEPGKGAKFVVRLPLAQAEGAAFA